MERFETNNYAVLCGTVTSPPVLSHERRGERFYRFPLSCERLSGAVDCVNVILRQRLLPALETEDGRARVEGEVRTFNNRSGEGAKLVISLFARAVTPCGDDPDGNLVLLTGTLCKPPTLRMTPRGRAISDLMLAVNRRYGRSDYIPCIVWGERALTAAEWDVGTVVSLEGRLQSRVYHKQLADGVEERTAYEISVTEIEET